MYRKTNIGALITYDAKDASVKLLVQFSKKRGVYADVATHYGVAITTVRRWVTTLADAGIDVAPKIERIRELALELEPG
jgi:transposase